MIKVDFDVNVDRNTIIILCCASLLGICLKRGFKR